MNQTPLYANSLEHRLAEQTFRYYTEVKRNTGEKWELVAPQDFFDWVSKFDAYPFSSCLDRKDVHRLADQRISWKLTDGTVIAESWRERKTTLYYKKALDNQ